MNAFTKDLTAADVHQPTSLGNDFAPRRRRQLSEDEAAAFQAYGQGPETERLRDLYDSQLRGNPHSPEAAFAAAWMFMGVKGQDAIRAEEAGESQPIKGNLKMMGKQAPVTGLLDAVASVFADRSLLKGEREYVLSELVDAYRAQTGRDALADIRATAAVSKANSAPVTKARITAAVHHVADASQQAGETVSQARARYWESAAGRAARAAFKRAPDDEPAPRAQPVVSPGMQSFIKAAEARAARDGVPLNVAKLAIAESRDARDRAIWTEARKESRA
jgi:hypothetical protein